MIAGSLLFAQQSSIIPLGPSGGIITHLTGSPSDDIVFAVVKGSGLYRSVNGGESWNLVASATNDFSNLVIGQITIHPFSSNTVLMTTSKGLYTSNDKGVTWTAPATFPSPTHSVKFAPANPNIVFGSDDNGVLRSNDGGKTWFPLKDNVYFGNRAIYNITVHPSDVTNIRLIVSTSFGDTTALFFSPNGGQNWRPFNKGLPLGAARRIYGVEIDTMGIGRTNFRALTGTADGMYGLQTDQADSSWLTIKANNLPIAGVITAGAVVYDRFDPTIGPNGEHKFSFFLASNAGEYDGRPMPSTIQNGVFKIEAKLNSIIPISPLPFNQPVVTRVFNGVTDISAMFAPSLKNKGKLYLGTSAGIYVSNDTGVTWQQKNTGIDQSMIRNLVSLQQSAVSKQVFAGIYGGGVVRSNDEGASWNSVNLGLNNPYITGLAADHKRHIVYAGTPYTLYRSTNLGASWNSIFTVDSTVIVDPVKFRTGENEMTIRVSERNPDLILFRSKAYGMRLSTNGGGSWSLIDPPLPVDTLHVPEHFAFDPVDSLTIYFSGFGLYRSKDLGKSWTNISGNLPASAVDKKTGMTLPLLTICPTINPKNTNEILLPSVFDTDNGVPYRIFKTTNGGTLWDTLQISAYDALYDAFDDRRILASGPHGIFGSENGGGTWKRFTDTSLTAMYTLIDPHAQNPNIFYTGSQGGGYKLEFTGTPLLTVDTTLLDFGSIFFGTDSVSSLTMRNTKGDAKVVVKFLSLSDSLSFRYQGSRIFEILPGETKSLPVRFIPQSAGARKAVLMFQTNDPLLPSPVITLTGNAVTRNVFEKFVLDFGSVTVGKDSILSIPIDNKEGIKPVTVTFLKRSGDTTSFNYIGPVSVTADSGKSSSVSISFSPRATGERTAYFLFSTTDIRFPFIQYRLKGVGVAKNFMTRKILMDTSVGFVSSNGAGIADYYKILTLSMKRSDISVLNQKTLPFDAYNALLFVQPNGAPPAALVDSLQRYVANGGTIVLAGDSGPDGNTGITSFLNDSGWVKKYGTRTGLTLKSATLMDTSFNGTPLEGIVTAYPSSSHVYVSNVDSVIAYYPGSIAVDTSVRNAESLLKTRAESLMTMDHIDTGKSGASNATIAALTRIGKGRIVLLSDVDLWWNGIPEDTTKPLGVFGGKNLQFAFNIFGLIDNLVALLEPTPQEMYEMISIPYAFSDSSVEALFKDLGRPNKLLWRFFGKYDPVKGYAEYPEDFRSVKRGEAYWLIAKNPVNVNLGTTTVQGTEEDFEITLRPGYNMVGNPFPYNVSWQNSFRPDSVENVLWSYNNGRYDSVTTVMNAFHGYWIKNRGKLPKTIRISSLQASGTAGTPKQSAEQNTLKPGEWKVRLSARTADAADEFNFVGAVKGSVDGLDVFDISEPPTSPSGYVSISFRHTEGKLAADYRSISDAGYVWDFDVASSQANIPVSIDLTQFGAFDPSFKIYLLDNKQERVYDMTGQMSYTWKAGKSEHIRSFRLIVGSEAFVEKNTNGIPLVPVEYSLSQNFPNPFNPVTTIRYSLSHSGLTTVDIFNVLGQKIRTLINEFQPIGQYSVQWDGRDAAQSVVSSGVYYYRVQCNEFLSVKKMTFIK